MSQRQIRRAHERTVEREGRRGGGLRRKVSLTTGAGLGVTAVFAPAAQAETFEVTNTDATGPGSLEQATDDANANGEDDVITFQAGLSGTILLEGGTSADIDIRNDEGLDIQGPGADQITVDADGQSSVFSLYDFDNPDEQVRISGLTITGGDTPEGSYNNDGGGIYSNEEGLSNSGYAAELTLDGVVITDNYADYYGGGIYADEGSLTITNSIIDANNAYRAGGGVYVRNTDGDEDVEVTIANSVVSSNESYDDEGGGVYVDSADAGVLIQQTSISDNTSFNEGGGGKIGYADGPVTLDSVIVSDNTVTDNADNSGGFEIDLYDAPGVIRNSTISGNESEGGVGGGLNLDTDGGDASFLIENSTVSGNSAYYDGGGIYFGDLYDEATATIRNSTIVENVAGTEPDAGDDYGGGGIYLYESDDAGGNDTPAGPVTLSSTIVANNSADFGADLARGDFTEEFELGFSLVEDAEVGIGDRGLTESPAGSNIFGADPQLSALASNGGLTQTHRPAASSPAIDAGIANGLATDQRGLPRTFDAVAVANAAGSDGTDIGAVEVQPGEGGLPGNAQCQGATVPEFKGTDGNDTLNGTPGPDFLRGQGGNDTASGAGGNDCVNGDAGRDNVKGGPGKDTVKGGGGADRASGGGGKDKVKGNAGKDKLKGGGGNDKLAGAGGKDTLKGGGGKDRLKGGPGKDKLVGGGGKDRFNCGGGNDKVTAQPKDKVSASCETVVEAG